MGGQANKRVIAVRLVLYRWGIQRKVDENREAERENESGNCCEVKCRRMVLYKLGKIRKHGRSRDEPLTSESNASPSKASISTTSALILLTWRPLIFLTIWGIVRR